MQSQLILNALPFAHVYLLYMFIISSFPFHGVLLLSAWASNTFLVLLQCLYNLVFIIKLNNICYILAHISCRIVRWQTVKHHFEQKGLLSSPAITCRRELLDIIITSWFLGLHNTKQEYGITETTALYHLPQRRCLSIWFFFFGNCETGSVAWLRP